MRASWQIHDVNTFVSPPKWAAVSSLPNKCQPNKTSRLHTNAITPGPRREGERGRGPSTGRKTHCDATRPRRIRPVSRLWRRAHRAAQRRAKLTPFRLPRFKFAIRSIHVANVPGHPARAGRTNGSEAPRDKKAAELITPLDP